jgi:hypothetical protein
MIVFRSRPLFVALILAIGLGILPGRAVAQVATTSDADLMNASWACLVLKFRRHVGNQGDPGHPGAVEPDRLGPTEGYDPNSGRNFAWDSEQKAWIDAKTGECICPKCPPKTAASAPASAQSGQAAQPPPETGSSVPGFGFGLGVGGFGRGQDRSKDSDRRP